MSLLFGPFALGPMVQPQLASLAFMPQRNAVPVPVVELPRFDFDGGIFVVEIPPGFPTQFAGLRVWDAPGQMVELCLVAEADAPGGMGGVWKIRKGVVNYAVYLVETSDPNATTVRVRTTTGNKAARVKT